MRKYRVIQLLVIIGLMVFAIRAGAQEGEPKVEPGRGTQTTGRIPYNSTGGPDSYGYRFYTNSAGAGVCDFTWIQSATLNPVVFSSIDDGSATVNLSSPFTFYGRTYDGNDDVTMSTNGYLSFPGGGTGADFGQDCPIPAFPNNDAGGPRMMPWHEDLVVDTGAFADAGGLSNYFADCARNSNQGSVTEPCTVFMWRNLRYFGGTGPLWFQAILYHQTNELVYQYLESSPAGQTPTVGIQNADATAGLAASCGYDASPNIIAGTAICFRQSSPNRNPVGMQTVPVKNLTWTHIPGEEWYHVVLSNTSGFSYDKWFQVGVSISCGGTCSIPAPDFVNGRYDWKLEYWKDGAQVRSDGISTFTIFVPPPAEVNQYSPFDGEASLTPVGVLTWGVDPFATWYHVVLTNDAGNVTILDKWYKGADVCTGTLCKANVPVPPASGSTMIWKMQAWGPGGTGPWDTIPTTFSHTFAVPAGTIARVSPPNGGNAAVGTVTLTWVKKTDIVWYFIGLVGPGGFTFNQWYHTGDVCGVTNCSAQVTLNTPGIYDWTMKGWNPTAVGNDNTTTFTLN